MEAGRELDALVAEKVMGLVKKEMSGGRGLGWFDATGKQLYWPDTTYSGDDDIYLPDYSTDIAAAWEVWEWMQSKGWHVDLISGDHLIKPFYCKVYTRFYHESPHTNSFTEGADTAPHAICLAALGAKGVKV